MKVVILTGMPGAGKSTAVEVAREMDIPVYRMGDAVWEEVRSRDLALEPANVGMVASEMRETHGPDIWARRTVEMVRDGPEAPLVIVDGCRSKAELDRFREAFGEATVILAVTAPVRTRFERLRSRERDDDISTWEEFEERERRELGWGLSGVIEDADIYIENSGTRAAVQRRVREILKDMARRDREGEG